MFFNEPITFFFTLSEPITIVPDIAQQQHNDSSVDDLTEDMDPPQFQAMEENELPAPVTDRYQLVEL